MPVASNYVVGLFATLALLVLATGSWAQGLLPNAQQQFLDNNGDPLAAGKVYTYVPGTTTPVTTYQNLGLSVPNSNPITLDAGGFARIWAASGTQIRQIVTDLSGSLVWDQVTEVPGLNTPHSPSGTGIGHLAVWGDTTGTTLIDGVQQSVFTPANTGWGQTAGLVSIADGKNGIVGVTINNLGPSVTAFPVGTVGYGLLYPGSNGNAVFGMYGEADLATFGSAVGAEIDCFNYSAAPPVGAPPPNQAIGTPDHNCIGLQVGAGGSFGGVLGVHIGGAEGGVYAAGSPQKWVTGLYIGGNTAGQSGATGWGLYIDADTNGPATSAHIANYGTGVHLELANTGPMVSANAVISVLDSVATSRFAVKQNGDVTGFTYNFNGHNSIAPGFGSCGTSPSMNAAATDARGIVTVGGGGVTSCDITFGAAFAQIPACIITGENIVGLSITAKTTAGFTVAQNGGGSISAANFDFVCMQ